MESSENGMAGKLLFLFFVLWDSPVDSSSANTIPKDMAKAEN
jgi:hypothetical protein